MARSLSLFVCAESLHILLINVFVMSQHLANVKADAVEPPKKLRTMFLYCLGNSDKSKAINVVLLNPGYVG